MKIKNINEMILRHKIRDDFYEQSQCVNVLKTGNSEHRYSNVTIY